METIFSAPSLIHASALHSNPRCRSVAAHAAPIIDEPRLQSAIEVCNRGVVVLVMLALKVFVKSAYGLSEQRLDEWQPNRPSKITCQRRPHQVRGLNSAASQCIFCLP